MLTIYVCLQQRCTVYPHDTVIPQYRRSTDAWQDLNQDVLFRFTCIGNVHPESENESEKEYKKEYENNTTKKHHTSNGPRATTTATATTTVYGF